MRNLETSIYLYVLYFFLIALSFKLGRQAFCIAVHISLKQLIKVYLSTLSLSNARLSDFTLKMESDSISAVKTKVFMQ